MHPRENYRKIVRLTGNVKDNVAYVVVSAQHSTLIPANMSSGTEGNYTHREVKEERSSCTMVAAVSWLTKFAMAASFRSMRLSYDDQERL